MTVRRQGEATFNIDKATLVGFTQTILSGNPIYKNTKIGGDGSFTTNVKPGFYLLSTPMTMHRRVRWELRMSGSEAPMGVL